MFIETNQNLPKLIGFLANEIGKLINGGYKCGIVSTQSSQQDS